MKKITARIKKVDCANCAAKIEDKIKKLKDIHEVNYHFMTEKLTFRCSEEMIDSKLHEIERIVHRIEPDAEIEVEHHHHEEHCECGHEHHHHEEHCECGHEHHHHEEHCECAHEHHHHEEHCECAHEHHHHEEHCECGHEHHHHEEHCECGHEHHHHEAHCECGHEHHHHEEHCECGHEHHHHEEHCECGHEHHHHEAHCEHTHHHDLKQKYTFVIEGLDCANCAAKVERHLNQCEEFADVQILFMNKTIKLNSMLEGEELRYQLQKRIEEVEHGVQVLNTSGKKETVNTEKKVNLDLIRLLAGVVLLVAGFITAHLPVSLVLFTMCYVITGYDVLLRAVRNILKGQVFDENFLMAIATVGAIVVSEYAEACAVMVFYQIGEYFQNQAVEKSRRSISELMDIRPDEAHVERKGHVVTVHPEDVQMGEILVVRPGEKVALDGIIIEGKSSLDTRALTGESRYQSVEENDEILNGVINVEGVLRVRVTKPYHDSTVARILELVENAGSRKAPAEAFITRFAKVYTPLVCLMALLIAFVPPLVLDSAVWMDYLYRACTFLVISCPCALVVSVPLTYFAGIGGLSAQGVLVKGGSYLDALNSVDTYVFDKTGTLTEGSFELTKVISECPELTLRLASSAEQHSNHPIAQSVVSACKDDLFEVQKVQEIAGRGIVCTIDGSQVLAGNDRLMQMHHIEMPDLDETGTLIHVAKDQKYLGTLLIQDKIRPESKELINSLKRLGKKVIMLTGDEKHIAQKVADELSVDEVFAQLLPSDKVAVVEKLIASGRKPAFTGDGINDAPVLAMATVGFAMGGIGSDAAIEASDIVIMNDSPKSVLVALRSALKTRRIVMENIYGALFVKFVILLLGALGKAGMWAAVFADVGVAVLAILNAIRAMDKK